MSLKGKTALVTGGTGALGLVIAQRLSNEGARLSVSCRNVKEIDRFPDSYRNRIQAIEADVTVEADVTHLFDKAGSTNNTVDILVNTVGGFLPRIEIPDITVAQWDKMMDINLKSTFLCTREALRRMKNKGYGRIVNISAMVGLRPSAGRAAYAISKSAITMLTDIAAQEQKGSGITINAIAPSIIDTQSNRRSMPTEDFSTWVKPEHLADIVCYLCSDSAKDVSGTTIKAFGGL